MLKRFLSFLLLFSVMIFSVACGKEEKHPYSHCEFSVPLTEDFHSVNNENFDASYSNGVASVAILRVSLQAAEATGIPITYSAKEFGEYWLRQNQRDAYMHNSGGVDFCDYTQGETFNLAAFYLSKSAYFVMLFAVNEQNEAEWRPKFIEFAKGVWFTD